MFISDNSECFTVRRGQPRARSVPRQDAAGDDDRAGGHLPLNLCTHSTSHSADTSECISTTSWMQQSGVYRRQTACALIVVSGELVALSSLAQHRCRLMLLASTSRKLFTPLDGLVPRRTLVGLTMLSTPPGVGVCGITRGTLAHCIPVNTSVQNILHSRAWVRALKTPHTHGPESTLCSSQTCRPAMLGRSSSATGCRFRSLAAYGDVLAIATRDR